MYLLIAGNKDASLDWSVLCQQTCDYLEDIEADDYLHCDVCYCVDGDTGRVVRDYKVPSWENRNSADSQQAIKLIAERLSSCSMNTNMSVLREIEEYAKSKGVPFCADLHCQFVKNFNDEYPYWDSSSAQC